MGCARSRQGISHSASGRRPDIKVIEDVTPLPHNGCRPRKNVEYLIGFKKRFEKGKKMARYVGPQCRLCRREGENYLKRLDAIRLSA